MYHPTTRALAVLELLQAHRRLSGAELAARLGVDRRTLRRYIAMLEELGIPIATERGRYGAYLLVAGFKLPPMMFSEDEALALSVGLVAARGLGLNAADVAVESAQAKLERVMPAPLQQRVRALGVTVALDLVRAGAGANGPALIALSAAAEARQRVHLAYRSAQGADSAREFDAYGIAYRAGAWYAVGWCHLRNGLRSFRLDRVQHVEPRPATFARPADFDALAHLATSIAALPRAIAVEVLLHTDLPTALRHVHGSIGALTPVDGGVRMVSREDDLDWYARQLARLPFAFRVAKPAALRTALKRCARALVRNAVGPPRRKRGASGAKALAAEGR